MNQEELTDLFVRALHGEATGDEMALVERAKNDSDSAAALWRELEEIHLLAGELGGAVDSPDLADAIIERLQDDSDDSTDSMTPWWRDLSLAPAVGAGMSFLFVFAFLPVRWRMQPPPLPEPPRSGGALNGLTTYNDSRISNSIDSLLTYLEGSVGSLCMLGCALLALVYLSLWASARKRRHGVAALVLALLAVGVFVARSAVSAFFAEP